MHSHELAEKSSRENLDAVTSSLRIENVKEIMTENSQQKTSTQPTLSLERQLELAKYFYINELKKTQWKNIILQVIRPATQTNGTKGFVVSGTNAATNAVVELFLDEYSLKSKDEEKIMKKLRGKGVTLAEEDVRLFFLVPEKLE